MISSHEQNSIPGMLVVEDSYLLGMQMKQDLETMGMKVHGPVPSVQKAMHLIEREKITAAILDINLGQETSFPIAKQLKSMDIPFVFITGYDDLGIVEDEFSDHSLFRKPVQTQVLYDVVRKF